MRKPNSKEIAATPAAIFVIFLIKYTKIMMTLELKNQISKRTYTFEVEELDDSRNYWHFNIELEEGMDDGEYKYILYDEFGVGVSDGTLQIGDYTQVNNIYETTENNGYIQYKG